ncbi:MAG: hypothetical protein IPK82_30725 [Polyangiaceae bacterium]|nr:hypothetical protein [Polyangiaceae bacterium]
MNEAVRGRLPRRMGRFFPLGKLLAVPLGLMIGAGWWLSGCKDDPTEPFMCGVEIGVQKGKVQNCNLPDQVCICETHSCAQKVAKTTCRSGYQYVGEPYLTDRAKDELDLGTGGAGGGMAGAGGGSGGADSKDQKPVVYAATLLCVPESYLAKRVEWNADNRICKGEERGTGGAGGTGGASTSSSGQTGGGGMGSTSSTSGATGGSGTGGMTTGGGGTSTGSAGAGGTGGMP